MQSLSWIYETVELIWNTTTKHDIKKDFGDQSLVGKRYICDIYYIVYIVYVRPFPTGEFCLISCVLVLF